MFLSALAAIVAGLDTANLRYLPSGVLALRGPSVSARVSSAAGLELLGKRRGIVPGDPRGVDADGDGDAANDPGVAWFDRERIDGPGRVWEAAPVFHLDYDGLERKATVVVSIVQGASEVSARADYGFSGTLTLGGVEHRALLVDDGLTGDFTKPGIVLLLDVNRNGRFDRRGETFDAHGPFRVEDVTYRLRIVDPAATRVSVVRTDEPVQQEPAPAVLQPGRRLPAFEATTTAGERISIPDERASGLTLLQFWASWCSACDERMPELVRARREVSGIEFVGIALEHGAERAEFEEALKRHGIDWPQVVDEGGWKGRIASLLGLQGLPALVLVDRRTGTIVLGPTELVPGEVAQAMRRVRDSARKPGNPRYKSRSVELL